MTSSVIKSRGILFVFFSTHYISTSFCTDAIATLASLEVEPHATTSMNATARFLPAIVMPGVQTHLVASCARAWRSSLVMDGTSVKVSICYIYRANIPCRFHNLSVCTSRVKYTTQLQHFGHVTKMPKICW